MNFKDYQQLAARTAIYPNRGNNLAYPALGLCGESGEVAEKIKKYIRDGTLNRVDIGMELGDVLWYVAALCDELGLDMQLVASMNIDKLYSRQKRDKLHGSGDER